jgi:hypothetical protein
MDITISLNLKEVAAVQAACDAWNVEREAEWNATEAGKPEMDRQPYAPVTAQRFIKDRCNDLVRGLVLRLAEAEEVTLTRRFRRLTDEEKATLLGSLPAD